MAVFEAAVTNSPSQSVDIVIANAGIIGKDDLYTLQGGNFYIPFFFLSLFFFLFFRDLG